jgi:hypothetical protein
MRIISVRDFEKRDKHQFQDMNEDTNEVEPPVDPDNPPLTGKEVWVPARAHFLKKYAEIKARIAARKQAEQEKTDAAE